MNALDRAIAAARADAPPRLDPARARRMVDVALDAASAPAPRRWRWPLVVAPPLLAAAAMLVVWLGQDRGPPRTMPSELSLPSGDWIATTPGAQLDVSDASVSHRMIRLTSGTALFDVRPLGAGEQFVVKTPDLEVHVVGTVFTVEVAARATNVRVYEGHVRARRGSSEHELDAGHTLGPSGIEPTTAGDPLGELAANRARVRIANAGSTRAPAVPSVHNSPVVTTVVPLPSSPAPEPAAKPAPKPAPEPADASPSAPVAAWPAPAKSKPGNAKPASLEPRRTERTRARAVALLAERKFAEARDLATQYGWHVVEGDAHRGLGDYAAAASAYVAAANGPDSDDACIGALLAAQLHADRLNDPKRAVSFGERAAGSQCATRERALGFVIMHGERAGSRDKAIAAARRYLAEFPSGDHAKAARALLTTR
ncbi:MAG: FecR domain-containing protein [Kofleriaceae bacterium]